MSGSASSSSAAAAAPTSSPHLPDDIYGKSGSIVDREMTAASSNDSKPRFLPPQHAGLQSNLNLSKSDYALYDSLQQRRIDADPFVRSGTATSSHRSVATSKSSSACGSSNRSLGGGGGGGKPLHKQQRLQQQRETADETMSVSAATTTTTAGLSASSTATVQSVPGAMAVSRWGSEARVKPRISYASSVESGGGAQTGENGGVEDVENGNRNNQEQKHEIDTILCQTGRSKQILFLGVAALVLMVVGVVVVTVLAAARGGNGGQGQDVVDDDGDDDPLLSILKERFEYLTPSMDVFNDPLSPQHKALHWIAYNDTALFQRHNATHSVDDDPFSDLTSEEWTIRLEIRYVLAVLYYSTTTIGDDDDDDGWYNQYQFLSPSLHECNWTTSTTNLTTPEAKSGVICDSSNRITSIILGKSVLYC